MSQGRTWTPRALTATVATSALAALLMSGCVYGGGLANPSASPAATSPEPEISVADKQVPIVANSATPAADEGPSVSVSKDPSPSPDAEGEGGGSGGSETGDSQDSGSSGGGSGSGGSASDDDLEAPSLSLTEQADAVEQELFALANAAREDDGKDELDWSDCAAEQARDRAETARSLRDLAHETLVIDCSGSTVGENLVRGGGDAAGLHQLWMDSEGHRDNILHTAFARVGIGCVPYAKGDRTEAAENAADLAGWVCSVMFYG